MRAMVLEQPSQSLRAIEVERPLLDFAEVRVRVEFCGVCRTDLHILEGDLPKKKLPIIPGHQIVGVVEAVGSQVKDLKIGQRVGVSWLRATCGQCAYCTTGKENLCERAEFTGYDTNGGYAEYVSVSEKFAYPLPANIDGKIAAPLLCGGVIGYRALRCAEVPAGGTIGLFGFGSAASLTLQFAKARGYQTFVVSRGENHRELAMKLGAAAAVDSTFSLPRKLDSAILFAPAGELVPQALSALKRGGTLVVAGIHLSAIPTLSYEKHLFHEKTLTSVSSHTRKDALECLAEAAKLNIQPHVKCYPLESANEALRDLKEGRIDGSAVLEV